MLHACHDRIAQNFFDEVLSPEHRLYYLLPEPRDVRYNLRAAQTYEPQRLRTWRAKNYLLHYGMYTVHAVVLTKLLSQPLRQNVLFSPYCH